MIGAIELALKAEPDMRRPLLAAAAMALAQARIRAQNSYR
jgi:hypothetical protein